MIRILTLLLCATSCFGAGIFQIERKSTSTTAEVITVHLPTGSSGTVSFIGASVYCSTETEVTFERDGTAPTTTAMTVNKVNAESGTPAAAAYRASNVGSGTTFARHIQAAGSTATYDLTNKGLRAGENFTIRTSQASATCVIDILWREL